MVVALVVATGLAVVASDDRPQVATAGEGAPVVRAALRPLRYVALGDSYSAGEGLPPFLRGTEGEGCHRSRRAFPLTFKVSGRDLARRVFVACTGAVTDNVGRVDRRGAVTGTIQEIQQASTVQLGALTPRAWRTVDLVSVTIGGNDAGFGDAIRACLTAECDQGAMRAQILSGVSGARRKVAATYAAIARVAPNATIIVLGYPQLFPATGRVRPGCTPDMPRPRQLFLRRAADRLETVLSGEARRAGVFYAGVQHLFDGHERCGRQEEWGFGVRVDALQASYHPNVEGQRAYARGLRAFLRCVMTNRSRRLASGLPRNPARGRGGPDRCRP